VYSASTWWAIVVPFCRLQEESRPLLTTMLQTANIFSLSRSSLVRYYIEISIGKFPTGLVLD